MKASSKLVGASSTLLLSSIYLRLTLSLCLRLTLSALDRGKLRYTIRQDMIERNQANRDRVREYLTVTFDNVVSGLELKPSEVSLVHLPGKYEIGRANTIKEYPYLLQITYPQTYQLQDLPIPSVERTLVNTLAERFLDFSEVLIDGKISYNEGWVVEYLVTVIISHKGYIT